MDDNKKLLEMNDWMILNGIIYKIYTTDNFDEMREQFLEQMKMLLDFDSADFYIASSDYPQSLTEPVTLNCSMDMCKLYEDLDYSKGILYSGKSLVYRETDIISDENRVNTEYYKRVYQPNGWHYAIQMILSENGAFLGVVTFYRLAGKDDFQYEDVFLLDMLKDHMCYRLGQYRKSRNALEKKLCVTEAVAQYGLTRREHTILKLLMAGTETADICADLSISSNTLKKHILNIYRKLGIKSRTQMFKMIKEKEA